MENEYLNGTGLKVSKIALGTSTFGDQMDKKNAMDVMDYAVDQGINLFDTGDVYCDGESERIIGTFIKDNRSKVLVATKASLPTGLGVNDSGASRYHLIDALDKSLKRLKTDYVDIYYIHRPDRNTPVEETLQTMDGMVRSGKVRYIGFSNYTAWEACELLYTAKLHNLIAPVVAENPYNLITRGLDDEMTHFLEKYNVGLMIYNPLAGGLLTGKHTRGHLAENSRFSFGLYQDRYCSERNFDAIEQLSNIANSSGMSLLQLAMRWCLSQKIVNSTILGCSSIAQLKQNISLSEEGPLSEDILRECEKVWEMLKSQAYGYFFPWNGRKGQSKSGNLQG